MIHFSGWLGSAKGWLGSASIPSMPAMPSMPTMAMPSMPNMPSIPSIPGLRKGGEEGADGAVVPGAENPAAGVAGGEDDDKSRYLRYGPTTLLMRGHFGIFLEMLQQQIKHQGLLRVCDFVKIKSPV